MTRFAEPKGCRVGRVRHDLAAGDAALFRLT